MVQLDPEAASYIHKLCKGVFEMEVPTNERYGDPDSFKTRGAAVGPEHSQIYALIALSRFGL